MRDALLVFCGFPSAFAQPPGTPPPDGVFDQSTDSDSIALPIDAFLFLSESENQVVVPAMTWEELQRLMKLDNGNDVQRDSYTYQSLEISGTTNEGRAELEVVLRAAVESTANRWVSIPLRMENFHKLSAPDVSGVDEFYIRWLPNGNGYQLMVKSDSASELVMRMRFSARVETGALSRSLEFRLPDLPSKVNLVTDTKNATGEVTGRGDETVIPKLGEDERTQFVIESSGGIFSLHWGEIVQLGTTAIVGRRKSNHRTLVSARKSADRNRPYEHSNPARFD